MFPKRALNPTVSQQQQQLLLVIKRRLKSTNNNNTLLFTKSPVTIPPLLPLLKRLKSTRSTKLKNNVQDNTTTTTTFKKWSVVPQLRGRSVTVNKLWLNRFQAKQKGISNVINNNNNNNTEEDYCPLNPQILKKRMHESYVEEYLPFKSDSGIREDYINVYGAIRFGKVLEDLDAMAGSIAYTHCDDYREDTPPLTIVTASLDRIDLLRSIPPYEDIRICGFVSFVGKSSMEISVKLETVPEGADAAMKNSQQLNSQNNWPNADCLKLSRSSDDDDYNNTKKASTTILLAKFTFVARDPVTKKAAQVNQLDLVTAEERNVFKLGAENKEKRMEASKRSLKRVPPVEDEMKLVHQIYQEYIQYLDPDYHMETPSNVVWMKDTIQKSLTICMPSDRNIHGNIFGGYLMRIAFELGFSAAILYAGKRPTFTSLDEITFKKSVPIGSLLSMTAQIIYSTQKSFQVKVVAEVIDPLVKSRVEKVQTTNVFYFRFILDGDVPPPRVCPRSYDESMRYLEGRRLELRHDDIVKTNTSF